MSLAPVDIVVIGAGPYGLSLAAHLNKPGRSLRVFGSPMQFWTKHMPKGMCLKSEGFASSLSDPDSQFTLGAYCREMKINYADIGLPVRIETFIDYGNEFRRRYVPMLEEAEITSLAPSSSGFQLKTSAGETFNARRVVIATGIMNFASLPKEVASLPKELTAPLLTSKN